MAIVAWYISYWDLFPKYSLRTHCCLARVYVDSGDCTAITNRAIQTHKFNEVDDLFIGVLIFTESMLSVAVLFFS
jgi:hypothetical protein